MTGTLELAAFDARDIDRLATFYAALTGWERVRSTPSWITLRAPDGQRLGFQHVPEHVAPQWPGQVRPQQFHLDFQVGELEAAVGLALSLGATRLNADGPARVTLADPAGHPFDLCQEEVEGMVLFAVTIDAPDASGLARFYADLLGMKVTHDGDQGALITGQDGRNLMFQQVKGYNAPRWPDPAFPQQAHLDIIVDDLDEGEARVLELGAASMRRGGEMFRVFTDPAGHPFCLTL